MRILYMIDEMEAITAGGTERQVLQMIQLMQQAGAEVQLCTLRGTEWLNAEQAGCAVKHFQLRSWWSVIGMVELRRIYRWMRAQKVDILQTFFVEANIVGPILGHFAAIPVILGSRRNLNYWMNNTATFLQRSANNFATRLVANCEAVKLHVIATEKVAPEKVSVIYNGVDLSRFDSNRPYRHQLRKSLGLSDAALVFGMVSALRPIKGVEHFIAAAGVTAQRFPHARYILIGDGPLRPSLEELVRQHRLNDAFIFAGSQEDIPRYLQAFDVGVLSSDSEGFSNSILEYLASGLPVVATDVGGNPEAVGPAGILVPPRDTLALAAAMETLVSDPNSRLRLVQFIPPQIAKFTLERATTLLFQQYTSLLSESS